MAHREEGFTVGDWVLYESDNGEPYYYNVASGETQWNRPANWPDTPTGSPERQASHRSSILVEMSDINLPVSQSQESLHQVRAPPPVPPRPSAASYVPPAGEEDEDEAAPLTPLPNSSSTGISPNRPLGGAARDSASGASGGSSSASNSEDDYDDDSWTDESTDPEEDLLSKDPEAAKKREKKRKKRRRAARLRRRAVFFWTRVFLSVVAVGLLWVTTLSLAASIASVFVAAPSTETMRDSWEVSVDITKQERKLHALCADSQVRWCLSDLNETVIAMENEVARRRAQNKETVFQAELLAEQCTASYVSVYGATEDWLKLDTVNNQLVFTAACSPEEETEIRESVGDLGDVRSSSYALSTSYVRETNILFSEAAASISNRTTYDRNYLRNKTRELTEIAADVQALSGRVVPDIQKKFNITAAVDELVNCMAVGDGQNTQSNCPTESLVNAYKRSEQLLNQSYYDLRETMLTQARLTTDYGDAVLSLLSQVESVFSTLRDIADYLAEADIDVGDFPIVVGFPAPSVSLPPNPPVVFPPIDEQFQEGLANFTKVFDDRVAAVKQDVTDTVNQLSLEINQTVAAVPAVMEDYDPPPVVLKTDEQEENGEEFLRANRATLSERDPEGQAAAAANSSIGPSSNDFSSLDLRRNFTFGLADFNKETNLEAALDALAVLVLMFILADYLWRGYQTVRTLVYYWTRSGAGLPEIDIRKHSTATDTPAPVIAAQVVASPYFLYIGAAIVISIIVALVVGAYGPLYSSYKEGCVDGGADAWRNSTSFGQNSFAFAYNLAVADGDEKLVEGLNEYDARRVAACASNEDSAFVQSENEIDISQAEQNHAVAAAKVELFERCVDPSIFPDAETFFFRTDGSELPTLTIAQATACRTSFSALPPLQSAVFNCSSLPPCEPTCTKPNKVRLQRATHVAACRTESVFHAFMFRVGVAVLCYICLNVARVLFMTSMQHMLWRPLSAHTGGLTFLGQVNQYGEPQEDTEMRLQKQFGKDIKSYERWAYVYLLLSILAHVPYLIVLLVVPNPVGDDI